MKANKWMTAVAVVALSTSLAVAAPQGGKGHGRHGKGEFSEKLAAKLNLTQAQKDQIKQIRKNNFEQNKAFFEQARQTRQEIRAAREAGDTAKAEALAGTMEAQRAQFKQIRDAERTQFLAVLTPEQKAQFEAMKAERQNHRKHKQQ